MNDKNQNGSQAQGASQPITVGQIQGYLKNDLGIAIRCLDAIYTDPDLLQALAEFMHGRLMNAKHKKDLEAQQEIPLSKPL